ncbi:unnamed protein product, partial [Vitis vinifera]
MATLKKNIKHKTLVRYQLAVVVIVFNNGGVYGGDRRNPEEITGPYKDDPAPTSFVPGAAYHVLIEAFGGRGYLVGTPDELKSALAESFSLRKPVVINVTIDRLFAHFLNYLHPEMTSLKAKLWIRKTLPTTQPYLRLSELCNHCKDLKSKRKPLPLFLIRNCEGKVSLKKRRKKKKK